MRNTHTCGPCGAQFSTVAGLVDHMTRPCGTPTRPGNAPQRPAKGPRSLPKHA